jgi:purine-binding chemotaxis protein CheW
MSENVESYVLFELAGTVYGIPSRLVRHIEMFEHVTLVPNAKPAIDGVVLSRGQVIPALNLRTRFGFPKAETTLRTRIIFAAFLERTVGLVVDSAREFVKLPADKIGPIEETLTGIHGRYLQAVASVGGRLVLILDLEAVLNVDDVELPSMGEAVASTQSTQST